MTSFEETRAALRAAAAERAAAADRLRNVTEARKRLQREIDRLARRANSAGGAAAAAHADELRRRLSAAAADGRRLKGALSAPGERETELRAVFEPFTDPTEAVANVPDTHPFLLFPLRLETRFGTAPDGRRQLWSGSSPTTPSSTPSTRRSPRPSARTPASTGSMYGERRGRTPGAGRHGGRSPRATERAARAG